jgi:hypothetical protein
MSNLITELTGPHAQHHGRFRMAAMTGLLTGVAAHTSTVGQLFVMRVPTSETKKAIIRRVSCQFATTTAAGAQQPLGLALAVHRGATAVYTGGTAIDMFTVTNSQKLRAGQSTTMFVVNNVRIATTDTLTVPATQVIDAHPLAQKMFLSPVLGAVADVGLLDSVSGDEDPISLAAQEVLVIKNVVLMGASLVGYLAVNVEWDEVTL